MLRKLIVFILFAALALYGILQLFGTTLVAKGMEQSLGTKVKVGRLHLKFFPVELGIYGVKIMNYPGFEEPVMVSIPEVFVRVEASSLLKKTIHVKNIIFNLENVTVEKNRQGKINLKVLMDVSNKKTPPPSTPSDPAPQQPPTKPSEPASDPQDALKLQIDEAVMSLGKVQYVDYGTGARVDRSFDFNIENTRLKNVTDTPSLIEQVVMLVLQKIGKLALEDQVQRVAGQLINDAQGQLAKIFPPKK